MNSTNEWEQEYCKDLCDQIFQIEEYRSLGFSIMNILKVKIFIYIYIFFLYIFSLHQQLKKCYKI